MARLGSKVCPTSRSLSVPVEEAHQPPSACRPLAEAVRGYSRFTGKPLTPDSDVTWHVIMSPLLALTFDWEISRHIGFFTVARISLLWVAHTGIACLSTVPPSRRRQVESNPQVPAFLNALPLRKTPKTPADLVPAAKDQSTSHRWPLVIFSHGLGGGGTTYR